MSRRRSQPLSGAQAWSLRHRGVRCPRQHSATGPPLQLRYGPGRHPDLHRIRLRHCYVRTDRRRRWFHRAGAVVVDPRAHRASTMLESSIIHFFADVGRWLPRGVETAIVSDPSLVQRLPVLAGLGVLSAWIRSSPWWGSAGSIVMNHEWGIPRRAFGATLHRVGGSVRRRHFS